MPDRCIKHPTGTPACSHVEVGEDAVHDGDEGGFLCLRVRVGVDNLVRGGRDRHARALQQRRQKLRQQRVRGRQVGGTDAHRLSRNPWNKSTEVSSNLIHGL